MRLDPISGLLDQAIQRPSPNFDARENSQEPECIVIHCISLPPGQYGGDEIQQFFLNELDPAEHPYFKGIETLTVSAHFLISRSGIITQFVSTNDRAWHAGESVCLGRPKVNDFSVGIELEGLDTDENGFTPEQYSTLQTLVRSLQLAYPTIARHHLFGHSDIAPGRKPDPGPYFDWSNLL